MFFLYLCIVIENRRRQLFFRFMKESRCYGQYKTNLKRYQSLLGITDASRQFYDLSSAFSWQGTKEGYRFWNAKHNKWLGICYTIKKKIKHIKKK